MPNFQMGKGTIKSGYLGDQGDIPGVLGQIFQQYQDQQDQSNQESNQLLYGKNNAGGGLFDELGNPTETSADQALAGKFDEAGNWVDDTGIEVLNRYDDYSKTGAYSQADDSASKNWAQLFRNQGDTESKTNSMIDTLVNEMGVSEGDARAMATDLVNNPGKYEDTIAKFATGPGKYDEQLGTAYGDMLSHPGYSDAEKTALEQQGQLSAKAAADSLKSEAMRRASATGNSGAAFSALSSIGRDTTRGLGEQARQNILAEAGQKRADIAQGGAGLSDTQKMIDSRMSAMEGLNAGENQRRIAGTNAMGEMAGLEAGRRTAGTAQSGQMAQLEAGRMTEAAKAASARGENLAARKLAGIKGLQDTQSAIKSSGLAATTAGASQRAELANREKERLTAKLGLQQNLSEKGVAGTGGQAAVAGMPSGSVSTDKSGGISL